MLPFGRRERDNYHERGSFKVKLCQHVYASTMAEQMKVATLKSSFYYTKLLAEIWKRVQSNLQENSAVEWGKYH